MNLFITWDVNPVLFELGSLQVRYYGLCWAATIIIGFYVIQSIYKKENLSDNLLISLFLYIIAGTILGARLGHCLFYESAYFLSHPLEMLLPITKDAAGSYQITGYSGLASHGGVLGMLIAIGIYSFRNKINAWDLLDKLALIVPLTGAFIRFGNFFNSENVGEVTNMPFGVIFKLVDNTPRHATQLYEAIGCLIIFCILFYLYRNIRQNHQFGFIMGISLVMVCVFRFIIEYFKIVQEPFELQMRATYGVDMGQLLSIPFILFGIFLIIKKYPSKKSVQA